MNHFPIDLQLVISVLHLDGKRYYDLLDFLFHLNPDKLPDESWRQVQISTEISSEDLLFFTNEELTLLYGRGIPFITLGSVVRLLSQDPFGVGKRIIFWLNRAAQKEDQDQLIHQLTGLNNLYTKFNRSEEERLKESKLDLTYSFSETRKSLRTHFINSNIEKGLERNEAIERSYYQLCGISTIFDVADTFDRRRKF